MAATTAPSLTGTTVTITSEHYVAPFAAEIVATVYSFEKIVAVEAYGPDGVRRTFWEWVA